MEYNDIQNKQNKYICYTISNLKPKKNMKKMVLILLALMSINSWAQPLVRTHVETGDVEGVLNGDALALYKAIPYAAPPVKNLRWREPQPAKAWEGTRKCDQWGPWIPQPSRRDGTKPVMSEDCLYLSVTTPATRKDEQLPVMVWIHGGGFQTEHYAQYDWSNLAKKGLVVVCIEYRAGVLGFMAHPELTKESKNGHSGNYGLLDQVYALKWIQRNIASFGGDPQKVTIFGESAGGMSVATLCSSPLAKGLFRAAICQSGGSMSPYADYRKSHVVNASQKGAEQQGIKFQKFLGKKSLKQLRQMDALSLAGDSVGFYDFWPCVDGYVIAGDQYRQYERGDYNDVPVMIMTNSDEGALWAWPMPVDQYKKYVEQTFEKFAPEVMKLYPGNNTDETYTSYGDLFRDTAFGWPSYAWACLQSKTGKSPVYAAYLSQPSRFSNVGGKKRHGVSHVDDLYYINEQFRKKNKKGRFNIELALSEIMQMYWVNFAKTMNPNAPGLPYWPSFDKDKPTTMEFCNGASLINVPNREQMELMQRFYDWKRGETERERAGKNSSK